MPSSVRRSSIVGPPSTRKDGRRNGGEAGSARLELAGLEGLLAEQLATFVLVQAAPDPVALSDPQGVLEARKPDGAGGSEHLGLGLSGRLLLAPLEVVRGEEQGGVGPSAGRVELPAPGPLLPHPIGHARVPLDGPSVRSFVKERRKDSEG